MSDDNLVNFPPKSDIKYDNLEERIYNCFHASISFNLDHQKKCIYCLHNKATGNMLFEIMAKDMMLAAKQKNLQLTTFDCRQSLATALMRINDEEHEMEPTTKQKARTERPRADGRFESGDPPIEATSTTVAEGIAEVFAFPRKTTED